MGRTSGLANSTTYPRGYMEWDDPSESLTRKMSADDFNALISSRQVRDCVISDGVTSNRRIFWTLGAAGDVRGIPVSVPFELDVPASNPSETARIADLCSSAVDPGSVNSRLGLSVTTTGELSILQTGATGSDTRRFFYAGFRAAYSGVKGLRGMVVWPSGDTSVNPVVYIQGVDMSASFTLATAGDAPNWLATVNFTPTYYLVGRHWPVGRIVPHAPIIGTLTAAEVAEWTQTGRLPTWCEVRSGSAAPSYASDFSAGTNNWTTDGSGSIRSVAGNVDSIDGQDDWLSVETLTSTLLYAYRANNSMPVPTADVVTVTIHNPAGSAIEYFALGRTGSGSVVGLDRAVFSIPAGTTKTVSAFLQWVSGPSGYLVTAVNASGTTVAFSPGQKFYVRSFVTRPAGPIAKLVIQPCRIIDDAGSNGIPGVLTSGMTPITTRRDWRVRATVDMSTTGNKQLFGAAVFESPTNHAIDSIEAVCTGTPTVNGIGDGTTATRYAGSHALAAGPSRLTLSSTPFPADSAKTGLYANVTVTGGSAEKIIIRGHRID